MHTDCWAHCLTSTSVNVVVVIIIQSMPLVLALLSKTIIIVRKQGRRHSLVW